MRDRENWIPLGPSTYTHRKTWSFQLFQSWKQKDYAFKELPSNMYKRNRRGPKRPFTNTHLPPKHHEMDKKPCLKGHKVSGSFTNNTGRSSKWSCKDSSSSALVTFPQARSCLKQSSAQFLLAPIKRLKVERVRTSTVFYQIYKQVIRVRRAKCPHSAKMCFLLSPWHTQVGLLSCQCPLLLFCFPR